MKAGHFSAKIPGQFSAEINTLSLYSTGAVSVSNGNAIVTGSGTAWAVALVAGGTFYLQGLAVPILSVDSDTSLTLALDWPGTTATGAAYVIERENSEAANVVDLYDKLSRVLVTLSLVGITPNASGTISERDELTLAVGDKGFLFLHAELGYDFEFYRWSGSAWVGPFATRGVAGASGLIGIWRGPWLTATAYYVNDAVSQGGSSYICVTAHTSGTFATDLAASKWQLVAQKGDTGAAGTNGAPGVVQSIVAGANVTVNSTDPANPVISASGTPVETAVHAATSKATPVDADEMALVDSAASFGLKKLTWANLKGGIWAAWGALINGGTAKTAPVDADLFAIADSAASNATKKLTWANLKATLKTYTDTLYLSTTLARREVLTGARTYYVRTDGSDSNTGLVNNSGGAFLTLQKAVNIVTDTLDLAGFSVTIQVGAGTYSAGISMSRPVVGGTLTVTGDTTTPSNVVISTTSANAITASNRGVFLNVQGLKLTTATTGSCLSAVHGGVITVVGNMDFGAVPTNYAHLIAQYGGVIDINVAYNISGGASQHMRAEVAGSMIRAIASVTVTITGSPAFGVAFAYADTNATVYALLMTFSGTVTGKRYQSTLNSVINTAGSGASYFPGSVAGTTATGGLYN